MAEKKMVLMYYVGEEIDFMRMIKLLEVGLPDGGKMNFMEVLPSTESTQLTEIDDMIAIVTPLPDASGQWSVVFNSHAERDMYLSAQKVLAESQEAS